MSANGDRPATPDLLDALNTIEREAKAAQGRLARREAKNGAAALRKIQNEASDALARAGVRK